MTHNTLTLVIFSIGFLSLSFSQENQKCEHYKVFDAIFMYENHSVFNGLEYIDRFPEVLKTITTNNKFFKSYTFKKGKLTYDGQEYCDIEMKYDLLNDYLLIPYFNAKANIISLNPTMVKEFELLESKFVRLENNPVLKPFYGNGFFEILHKDDTSKLYTKHRKGKISKIKRNKVVYAFKIITDYFIEHDKQFYKLNTKRHLISIFPSKETAITSYYKNNRLLLKNNKSKFYSSLLRLLNKKDNTL